MVVLHSGFAPLAGQTHTLNIHYTHTTRTHTRMPSHLTTYQFRVVSHSAPSSRSSPS